MVSLWCEILYKLSIYTLKSDQWTAIWWVKFWVGMSTTNINLLWLKVQSHLQKCGLGMPVNQNSYQRKNI